MFGFLIGIGSFIAGLFQTSIDAIVTSLVWAVGAIQATIVLLWNGIKGALDLARIGFVKSWDFLGDLYDDVLAPAWRKFWHWFDQLRSWLNDTFGPVLQWLKDLRKQLLDFWKTYVRPWLDLIDVTRKLLNVLGSLGLEWARALDKRLGEIEDAITKPFLFLLGKLNEVINVVNSIAGQGGLLQRVALVRSIARDYQFVWKAITQPYIDNASQSTGGATSTPKPPRTLPEIADALSSYTVSDSGELAPVLDEMQIIWRQQIDGIFGTTAQ